jgi:hypothetical protein
MRELIHPGYTDIFDVRINYEPGGYCSKIICLHLSIRRQGGITVMFFPPLVQINLRDDLSACVYAQAVGMNYLPLCFAQASDN